MATMKRVLAFITATRLSCHSTVIVGHKYLLTLIVFALSFFASTSSLNAYDPPDSTSESEQLPLRPTYPCIPMWELVPSPFTPIWVPDWNTWIPAFREDALAFDLETGYVYYSANTNPPQRQPLGKTPGVLSGGAPRGIEVIYWGDPSDPQGHIAYQWSVNRLPPATTRITLEAGYLGNGGVFVSQAKQAWLFGDDSNGYTNGRNERDLYAAMYGEVPANLYGRLYEQLWGTVSKTKLEYRPASPFGGETKIYRENLNQDYTLLRHIDGDSDKKFNIIEVEHPRFDGSGVSLERVVLSPTNGQPVLREFFEGRNDRSSLWQEQYEYNYPADPLALTGYVDRQGNRYQWEYQQLSAGVPWRDGRAEQETVLTRAVDPTGVEVSLQYGERYTIPPWQVVRQNPPTIPSSVQLGRNSERRWRFGYTFEAGSQRSAPNGLLLGFKEPERNWWRFGYTSLSHPHPYQLAQITDPTERFSRITAWDAFGRHTRSEVYPYQGAFGWDTNRPVWQEIEYDPVGRVREVRWGYDERRQRYLNGSVGTTGWGTCLQVLPTLAGDRCSLSPATNTHGQSGFYLHGGTMIGSQGCIDVEPVNDSILRWIKERSRYKCNCPTSDGWADVCARWSGATQYGAGYDSASGAHLVAVVFDWAQRHRAFWVGSEPNDCVVDTGGDLELRSWAKLYACVVFSEPPIRLWISLRFLFLPGSIGFSLARLLGLGMASD